MKDCKPGRRILAQGSVCRVEACDCGVLHVSFGPVTLRLQREAVASLTRTLGEALRKSDPAHGSHGHCNPGHLVS